ncbi:MAG TPA: S41 family peptidase [Pyrinomonadaceae bacterium]|nr:S41 family peptidase [Pyrinomonadaceae bacterium]
MTIDGAVRSRVIDELLRNLNKSYISFETARQMEMDIRARLAKREYDGVTSATRFAAMLQEDLQAISHDKHLRVYYSAEAIAVRQKNARPTAKERAAELFFQRRFNWGFEKVERMEGNIGYLALRSFEDPAAGVDTVASAMGTLSNTDGLIIDLRQNGGGSPAMVALLSSYFFGSRSVHLNDIYWREGNKTEEFWTKRSVTGKKYGDKPIYILTSNTTFSAAEEFAYNLKNLKRATLIGEKTRGGANPGERVRLTEHFEVFVPMGKAVNPITQTNWEGIGVTPDVPVPKDQALKTAYIMALETAIEKVPYEYIKAGMREIIKSTQKDMAK